MPVYSYHTQLSSTLFSLLPTRLFSLLPNLGQTRAPWAGSAAVPLSAALILQKFLGQLSFNNQKEAPFARLFVRQISVQ